MQFTLLTILAAASVSFAAPTIQAGDCPGWLSAHEWHPHPSLCKLGGYTTGGSSAGGGGSYGGLSKLFGGS